MKILSEETEKELMHNLIAIYRSEIKKVTENQLSKPPYIQQKAIMKELGVGYDYFKKIEARGLKRVKLDPKDKNVFYRREDVYKLMDKLAE